MITQTPISTENISILDLEHPGANDAAYIARRNEIAKAAIRFRQTGKLPRVNYTDLEHKTWQQICQKLAPIHKEKACKIYLEGRKKLDISEDYIPEFTDLNAHLAELTGFRLLPIEGLVDSRNFLVNFTERTMLCTQYIRHHSKPEYTPEPDIIHEVIGHVPAFTDEAFVQFLERFGEVISLCTDEGVEKLDRIYWWTVEYGLIKEDGETKVFGAGLLGSIGEMTHAFEVPHHPFDPQVCMNTPFDYTHMQPQLFVIESLEDLQEKMEATFLDIINKYKRFK